MTRKIHTIAYPNKREDSTREVRLHQRRDADAAMQLFPALLRMGFQYGEPLLNPLLPTPLYLDDNEPLQEIDLSFVRPGDFLLQTTRPPLDDLREGNRKQIERTYTDVECRLFDVWRRYLADCARSKVTLNRGLRDLLPKAYEDHIQMEFREGVTAPYRALNNCTGRKRALGRNERRTAAFLLRVEQAWPNGPGLISAFGMDGTTTLVWAYRLGRDFSHLLAEPGFVLVEMENTGVPKGASDLRWARDWNIEIVLESRPESLLQPT